MPAMPAARPPHDHTRELRTHHGELDEPSLGAVMAEHPPQGGDPRRGPLGFRIIGALKLTTGLLLFAVWFGMFRLFKHDVADELEWAIGHLRLDPDNRLFHMAVGWISGLDREHLRAIEAGTFFYALLHVVEGTGLILERHWAGYLTIIATSSLIPFEGYEIIRKVNLLKILVLAVNLGFVVYLAVKLRQEHSARRVSPRGAGVTGEP
jgi:uncharacterized membrane protein (DUF2068 family)